MSKTIIAVRHFRLGSRESLETAVGLNIKYARALQSMCWRQCIFVTGFAPAAEELFTRLPSFEGGAVFFN